MPSATLRAILAATSPCIALLAGCTANQAAVSYTPVRSIRSHGPAYPTDMERLRQEGYVVMDCTVTASGLARDCRVVEATNLDFAAAAEAFVANARYQPATYGGRPVAVPHHKWRIDFKMAPLLVRLTYDCEVDVTGHLRNCHTLSAPKPVPQGVPDIVLGQLSTLSVVARRRAGQAVEEPHRSIEVLLALEINPRGHPRIPTLPPMQVQVDLLLDCRMDTLPRCREISEPAADAQPGRADQIIRAMFGFNGVIPTEDGGGREAKDPPTPAAAR